MPLHKPFRHRMQALNSSQTQPTPDPPNRHQPSAQLGGDNAGLQGKMRRSRSPARLNRYAGGSHTRNDILIAFELIPHIRDTIRHPLTPPNFGIKKPAALSATGYGITNNSCLILCNGGSKLPPSPTINTAGLVLSRFQKSNMQIASVLFC